MKLPYWLQPGSQNYVDYMGMVNRSSVTWQYENNVIVLDACIEQFEQEMWDTWRLRHKIWQYLPGMPLAPREERLNANLF